MSGGWTGCYHCGARLGPDVRRCRTCSAKKCHSCGACFCSPRMTAVHYQRYFNRCRLRNALAIYEVENGKGKGKLFALFGLEAAEGSALAVVRGQDGREYRVPEDYLERRCLRLV